MQIHLFHYLLLTVNDLLEINGSEKPVLAAPWLILSLGILLHMMKTPEM